MIYLHLSSFEKWEQSGAINHGKVRLHTNGDQVLARLMVGGGIAEHPLRWLIWDRLIDGENGASSSRKGEKKVVNFLFLYYIIELS